LYNAFQYIVDLNSLFVLSPLKIVLNLVLLPTCHQTTTFNQEKRTVMAEEGNNNHATVHKGGGEPDFQELEEPEALNVVIDGTSPSDYPVEETRKQWHPRVLLAVSALVVVSVALGVALGLTANKNSSPAPSPSPSSSPTSSVVNEFLSGLPSYSLVLASNNASSPQAEALDWLQGDPQYNEYQLHRLYQRYALAVLYYSTNGTYWTGNRGWLSDDNECTWYQIDDIGPGDDNTCMEASRLTVLSLHENYLDGTIPMELELLVDLEYMNLVDDSVSGKVHSEL
jgi:hypothetical protein